jgi:DNA-binding FrmR family transcriptional regulator
MTKFADQPQSGEQLRARLRRIEGQVRGIAKMLDSERSCEDIVTQLMAVRSSLDTVGALVLDGHLGQCLGERTPQDQVDALRDAMRLWWRFAPSAGGMGSAAGEVGAVSPLPDVSL